MSVKNGAKDLPKSIGSIQRQTLKDWEFIICDDGSTDGTFQCLKEYQEKDDRIVLLHNDKSMGLAFSLNRCIEVSRSNILARQDADDSSEPYIVSEEIKYNGQQGGGYYREVTYSDGNFRQYDVETGKLIGSSFSSDQSKLPSME